MSKVIQKYLVAGGAGFIGSHLVTRLLENPNTKRVTVVDNFSTGSPENLSSVASDPRLEVIAHDITDNFEVHDDFDVVLHLAAIANPSDYEVSPIPTLLVNSRGNENLIDIARRSSAQYFFFSSSEVYGSYDFIPRQGLSEDALSQLVLNQLRTPYPIGKCYGEELTKYLCRSYENPYVVIRPFNVYGPRMDTKTTYGRVIPNFIAWALQKQPLQVQGNGEQIRTFCHIDDFINGLEITLRHPAPPSVINIGSPVPTSIFSLAQLINRILANDAGIVFTERYPHETLSRIPDIGRISSLGWKPAINLEEGIKSTIQWFRTISKSYEQ